MITEDYISFETAKLLKEKGFDEACWSWYHNGNNTHTGTSRYHNSELEKYDFSKATLAHVMKWLRDIHNLDIITPPQFDNSKWTYSAIIFKLSIPCTEIRLNDNKDKKEAACEEAIRYCLTNLI